MRIEFDGVLKAYGETTAVDGVSFAVDDGEFFTLVGPSGCGKTTTLRLLAGFESPTDGTVRFDGRDVTGVPPESRGIGIVFQSYALFPHMTVAENVGYGLRFTEREGSTADRVAELLDLVGLAGFESRDPTALSGGQQQRVALARALAPDPDLLLLDEPMSALDARLRDRLRRDVREIQRDLGVTTVYVTHDQAEAMAISDRVAVMNDGRIEQTGPPKALYRRPQSRFVAEFLGENNVFEGVPLDTTGDISEPAEETGGLSVEVSDSVFTLPRVENASDARLTFCVRPSAFRVDGGETRLTGEVLVNEFLGETTRVYIRWGGRQVAVSLDDPPETETLTVGFDPEDVWVL